MSYKAILSDFEDKLNEIKRKTSTLLDESNQGYALCSRTLGKMKQTVESVGFSNKEREIHFFRNLKVVPLQNLIYYSEVRTCELRMPKIGIRHQLAFLEKKVDKVNSFFGAHTEFLIYLDTGYKHFDKHYFTRKHLNKTPVAKKHPYYQDPMFNTSYDGVLARIRGFGLLIAYIKDKKRKLEKSNARQGSDKASGTLTWTGGYAGFIEMAYGCVAAECFNNGNIDIKKVIEELGDFLNVERGNSTRTYNELKNRLKSQIKFFERTGQKLLDKMNREDDPSNKK